MVEKIPLLLCAFQARQFCSWTGLKCLTLKLTIWSTLSTAGPHVCASSPKFPIYRVPNLRVSMTDDQFPQRWGWKNWPAASWNSRACCYVASVRRIGSQRWVYKPPSVSWWFVDTIHELRYIFWKISNHDSLGGFGGSYVASVCFCQMGLHRYRCLTVHTSCKDGSNNGDTRWRWKLMTLPTRIATILDFEHLLKVRCNFHNR